MTATADYTLSAAFAGIVSGLFYIETSALDGTDGLSDLDVFAGVYDDLSSDVVDVITITTGTDTLAGSVQPSSLQCELYNAADPARWNPNNPGSVFNTQTPGFVPMRPVRLQAVQNGNTYGVFWGFIRRADWNSDQRSCQLYCEDLLLWANRVFPTIAATGPTTTGAAIGLILDAIGWTNKNLRSLSTGDVIPNFTADGTVSALQLIANLLQAERGTVFVRGDGVVVYEDRTKTQARASVATLANQPIHLESGIDLDTVYTRASVTNSNSGVTSTFIDAPAEQRFGRADFPEITSPYIPNDADVPLLAADLVYGNKNGVPPITTELDNQDDATLTTILASPLQSVFTLNDARGGTTGDFIVQRIVHTILRETHNALYTLQKRLAKAFTVDGSALDGTDPLRY